VLQAILAIIRLLIDPQLRDAVSAVRESASKPGEVWTKQIKRSRAKFSRDQQHLVEVFAQSLHEDFVAIGVSDRAVSHFETVFNELVENAFRHGCRRQQDKVIVTCDYSRWFLRLRVADSGKGFPFSTYRSLPYYQKHGLGVVSRLTTHFEANPRGNVITAMIRSHDGVSIEIEAKPTDDEIFYLKVSHETLWDYSHANWEPLRDIIDESGQNLVLIDCKKVRWSSQRAAMSKVLNAFSGQANRRLAYILDAESIRLFDLRHLNAANSRVFRVNQYEQARDWLMTGKT